MKRYSICERLVLGKKKVFKSCVAFWKVRMKSRECLNINDFRL